MNTPPPDPRLQRALERFVSQGGPFVLPAGPPPTVLLPEPPGGRPPDTKTAGALPTPPTLPHPPRRDAAPAFTPPPRLPGRAVVPADAVLASLDHAVWSVSPDGNLVFLLAGAVERVLGFPAEYFLDRPAAWGQVVPAADRPAVLRAFRRVRRAGSFAVEHRVRVAGEERQVVSRGRLVRRPDGEPLRVDGTTTEVTHPAAVAELRAQLAAVEGRLREAGRLEALGRLVGSVAHDFNHCLTVISGNAELVRDHLPPGDPLRERAAEVVGHVAAAAAVTRQLVAFGRPGPVEAGPVDLNAEVRGLDRLLRRLTGPGVTLDLLLTHGLPPVPVGAGALTQVVLNLVANARDATGPGGTVTLRTAEAVVDRTRSGWPPALAPGRYVALTVSDNGGGMTPDVLAKAFDPYFTTKGDRGNGLGLATVADIVRTAGGHVEIESGAGWGTQVRVYLPPLVAPAPVVPPTAAGETILLAQADAALRDLTASALQHAGYRVLEAADAADAEERARLYAGPIDLLVTDVPAANGDALAAALRAARPALKTLTVTGGVLPPGGQTLLKPYTETGLLTAVRRALHD